MNYIKMMMVNILFLSIPIYSMHDISVPEKELIAPKPLFLQKLMIDDIRPKIMICMNYRTQVHFIQTCKYLYNQYVTLHDHNKTLSYGKKIPLIFGIKEYTRALFYYAPKDEKRARVLLEMQDITEERKHILDKCRIDGDIESVLAFYQQKITSEQKICDITGDPENLKFLLKHGLSPNLTGAHGFSLLSTSVYYCNNESVKVLLEDDRTDINIIDKQGDTALKSAAYHYNIEAFKLLLAHPATDPNIAGYKKRTPLMNLIADYSDTNYADQVEAIVRLLLWHPHTDIMLTDSDGNTALSLAYQSGHQKVIFLLQKKLMTLNQKLIDDNKKLRNIVAKKYALQKKIIICMVVGIVVYIFTVLT